MDTQEESLKPIMLRFAPVWKRILAYLIDAAILVFLFSIMLLFMFKNELLTISSQSSFKEVFDLARNFAAKYYLWIFFMQIVMYGVYFILFWAATGQTLGAKVLQIAVIDVTGKRMAPLPAVLRFFLLFISINLYYVPLIFVMNPVYHQHIHDFLSRSVVVEMPRPGELPDEDTSDTLNTEDEDNFDDYD